MANFIACLTCAILMLLCIGTARTSAKEEKAAGFRTPDSKSNAWASLICGLLALLVARFL